VSQNQEAKVYAPASAKQVTFQSGKSILKLGVNVEKFIVFLNQHKNAKGYVNFGISERKEVSQYGETHTVWLDTWQPSGAPSEPSKPRATAQPKAKPLTPEEADDVPF
jgi:hypothetical protein